jgi:hypothetical protein
MKLKYFFCLVLAFLVFGFAWQVKADDADPTPPALNETFIIHLVSTQRLGVLFHVPYFRFHDFIIPAFAK